jgi:hypothetical protein
VNGFVQNDAGTITLTGLTTGIAQLTQAAGATFNLAGFDLSVGALSGAGTIRLGGSAQPAAAPATDALAPSVAASPSHLTLGNRRQSRCDHHRRSSAGRACNDPPP